MSLQAQDQQLLWVHAPCPWTRDRGCLEQSSPSHSRSPSHGCQHILAHVCQPWVGLLLAKLQSHSVFRVYSVLFNQAAEHQVTNELTERVNSWTWGKILPLSIRLEIYFKEGLKSHNLRGKLRENFSFEKDWLRFFSSLVHRRSFSNASKHTMQAAAFAIRSELILMSNLAQEPRPALRRHCWLHHGCLFHFSFLHSSLPFSSLFSSPHPCPIHHLIFGHTSSLNVPLCSFFLPQNLHNKNPNTA